MSSQRLPPNRPTFRPAQIGLPVRAVRTSILQRSAVWSAIVRPSEADQANITARAKWRHLNVSANMMLLAGQDAENV